jgi:hypothetical protein
MIPTRISSLPSRADSNIIRHAAMHAYRRTVMDKYDAVCFPHQAEWMAAAEGFVLTDQSPVPGQPTALVMLEDGFVEPRLLIPRQGGPAHALVDLAGFKSGKSWSLALFASGFAGIEGAAVDFIGLEYDTSEPEFNYLLDFLLSERGMNLKPKLLHNNKKIAMWLKLENDASFMVKSYRASRKTETMKGKTRDCYIFTEAYQLPGLHVYSHISQNLRQYDGFACWATTPDRAWVKELHEKGHGKDPYWHCTCDIDASCNPFTSDQGARDRDDPDKGGLMTKDRYAIAWAGKVNRHLGVVYDYEKGGQLLSPLTAPHLFSEESYETAMRVLSDP